MNIHANNVGDVVPDIKVMDATGHLTPLSQQMGDKGLLVFVLRGTWCSFCVQQIQSVQRNHHRYTNQGVASVFISPEAAESVHTFRISYPRPLPFGLHSDPTREMLEIFVEQESVGVLPATYLLNKDRNIVWRYIGQHKEDRPGHHQLTQIIGELL